MVAPGSLVCECIDIDIPAIDGIIYDSGYAIVNETYKNILQVGEQVTLRDFAEEG
jgi:hypothetical protein